MIIPHIRDIFICGILGHYHKWLRIKQEKCKKRLTRNTTYAIIVFVLLREHDGHSPSGKALDSDSSIRRFESFVPSEGCITEVSSAVRLFFYVKSGAVAK